MVSGFQRSSRNLDSVVSQLRTATKSLQVGWLEASRYDDGTPVAGIAAIQEFGSAGRGIPPRPFMRPAIADNKDKWKDTFAQLVRQWIAGSGSYDNVLTTIGLVAEGDIRESIIDGNHTPLSPITLALRRLRRDGVPIGASTVGAVAAAVNEGMTGPGQLGEPDGNTDPLRETGVMIATLTHEVI